MFSVCSYIAFCLLIKCSADKHLGFMINLMINSCRDLILGTEESIFHMSANDAEGMTDNDGDE